LWRKENLIDSFKKEIERQKDKESFMRSFVYVKSTKGRQQVKNTHIERDEALKELREHAEGIQ